jgi:hypothetical protein
LRKRVTPKPFLRQLPNAEKPAICPCVRTIHSEGLGSSTEGSASSFELESKSSAQSVTAD